MVSRLFEEDRPVRPVRIQQPLRAHTEYSAFSKPTPHSDFVAENNDTKLSFTTAKKKKKKKKAPVPAHYKKGLPKQRAKPKAGRRKVTPKKKDREGPLFEFKGLREALISSPEPELEAEPPARTSKATGLSQQARSALPPWYYTNSTLKGAKTQDPELNAFLFPFNTRSSPRALLNLCVLYKKPRVVVNALLTGNNYKGFDLDQVRTLGRGRPDLELVQCFFANAFMGGGKELIKKFETVLTQKKAGGIPREIIRAGKKHVLEFRRNNEEDEKTLRTLLKTLTCLSKDCCRYCQRMCSEEFTWDTLLTFYFGPREYWLTKTEGGQCSICHSGSGSGSGSGSDSDSDSDSGSGSESDSESDSDSDDSDSDSGRYGANDNRCDCPSCRRERSRKEEEEKYHGIGKTACGHVFCVSCLQKWRRKCDENHQPFSCPMCRGEIVTEVGLDPRLLKEQPRVLFFTEM